MAIKKTTVLDSDEGKKARPHVIILDDKEEELFNRALIQASEHMGRKIPEGYTKNLLKRVYHVINNIDSLYIIGGFSSKGRLNIFGETAWGVEMFFDKLMATTTSDHSGRFVDYPLYLFDQNTKQWYHLKKIRSASGRTTALRWLKIDSSKVPKPSGNYGGIGSRDVTPSGILAVQSI